MCKLARYVRNCVVFWKKNLHDRWSRQFSSLDNNSEGKNCMHLMHKHYFQRRKQRQICDHCVRSLLLGETGGRITSIFILVLHQESQRHMDYKNIFTCKSSIFGSLYSIKYHLYLYLRSNVIIGYEWHWSVCVEWYQDPNVCKQNNDSNTTSAQRVGFFNIGLGRVGYWTKYRVAGQVRVG